VSREVGEMKDVKIQKRFLVWRKKSSKRRKQGLGLLEMLRISRKAINFIPEGKSKD